MTDRGCREGRLGRRPAKFSPEIGDVIERIRFWAGSMELQRVLGGIRTGDLSWFTVHIGCARDVMPAGSGWEQIGLL